MCSVRRKPATASNALRVAVLTTSASLAIACSTMSVRDSNRKTVQADPRLIALLNFQQSHKNCRVWTDWNRVCSRKPGTKTPECLNSQTANATPSAPFCASGLDSNFDRMTSAELESSNRFCATFMDQVLSRGAKTLGPYHVCVSHLQRRPFSNMALPSYFCREVPAKSPKTRFRPGDIDVKDRRIPVVPAIDLRPCK
jgi:hypothetical protein